MPTNNGLLRYYAIVSEPLESKFLAPAAEVAATSRLLRAAALAELDIVMGGGGGESRYKKRRGGEPLLFVIGNRPEN